MKIILSTPNFFPSIGGVQGVALDLAMEFTRMGHEIKVITRTLNDQNDNFPFEVIRQPSFWKALKCTQWGDVIVDFNLSLKVLPLYFFSFIPLVLSHHGIYPAGLLGSAKIWVANHMATRNIACSRFVAEQIKNVLIIQNPYKNEIFKYKILFLDRKKDLVFLGRLVPEKGVDLLLESLSRLKNLGLYLSLSIIGSGNEEKKLQKISKKLELKDQVIFLGNQTGETLSDLLNEHKILVIPSLCEETFGIVALEGIASGCLVIGSEGGGLKEAIGPCGLTFPNGDVTALAQTIKKALFTPNLYEELMQHAPEHLKKHNRSAIAQAYLEVIEQVLNRC